MEFDLIESLLVFLATFLFVMLVYIAFVNRKRKNMKTEGSFTEPSYLIKRFNLNTKKISYKKIMWITTFINAFIIGISAGVVIAIESLILELIVGFIMLLVLIFLSYEILGKILVTLGYAKKEHDERS